MRFSLQDIKKSVRKQQNELAVSLHFLQPGELSTEIAQLILYYERLLGQPYRLFSVEDANACIGDYRLAHCLIATLSHWYMWQQREWSEVVQTLNGSSALAELSSPVQLRLSLYDYVNEHFTGFLDADSRDKALAEFAESYTIQQSDLEYLLAMDTDEEARLTLTSQVPPTPQEVATLYNQWAFEAALCNASSVRFLIDYNAFSKNQTLPTTGVGAVIKRLCFLARKIGVYYDLAYEQTLPGMPPLLSLTLYGPQEVTGSAQQYGLRLARLCRILMGYSVARSETTRKIKKPSFATSIVEARANVHFLQRTYLFKIDAALLKLLPQAEHQQESDVPAASEQATIFDSSIEQSFAEAFSALARSQGVDGWQLEREPEPLLLDHSIFIPDFALTRAHQRIYVEILGFWTPTYRERKLQKLQQLQGRNDLVLALPSDAHDAFASILSAFPNVLYEKQLSATDLLAVLRTSYDDFSERLALIDICALRERVRQEGLLNEQRCLRVLNCYRRSELQEAALRVVEDDLYFTAGIGLYSSDWMQRVQADFLVEMRSLQKTSLANALRILRSKAGVLLDCEDETLEAILQQWVGVQVVRESIFDARVELVSDEQREQHEAQVPLYAPQEKVAKLREKRPTLRKPRKNEDVAKTEQGNLWI